MPELPEVETTVRALRPFLVGQTVLTVETDWLGHVGQPSLAEMQSRLHGREILAIERRAKYLLFQLSQNETLIIHLKMSGRLAVFPQAEPRSKHVHSWFPLANGQELRFWDQRKFGRIYLLQDPELLLGKLGPEPLTETFTPALLGQRLHGRKRPLKTLLLDQTFIAGVGNIYADEALFYAGLHPQRYANTLQSVEIEALHTAVQKALRLGIERGGATIGLYLKPDGSKGQMQDEFVVYGQTGAPCRQCGAPIQRLVLGGRSTHFCLNCQR